jgi:hypothetical protein
LVVLGYATIWHIPGGFEDRRIITEASASAAFNGGRASASLIYFREIVGGAGLWPSATKQASQSLSVISVSRLVKWDLGGVRLALMVIDLRK